MGIRIKEYQKTKIEIHYDPTKISESQLLDQIEKITGVSGWIKQ